MTVTHKWSGWPGAYCMDCGNGDPTGEALCCQGCDLKTYPGDNASDKMCPRHQAWVDLLATGCPPDPEAVKSFNQQYAAVGGNKDSNG